MKLYFKQRFFSWFDSYDIYYEDGSVAYTVEGKLAWGHCLHILDPYGEHIATVKQQVLTFLPKFDLYVGERCIGTIRKEFTFFHPSVRFQQYGRALYARRQPRESGTLSGNGRSGRGRARKRSSGRTEEQEKPVLNRKGKMNIHPLL